MRTGPLDMSAITPPSRRATWFLKHRVLSVPSGDGGNPSPPGEESFSLSRSDSSFRRKSLDRLGTLSPSISLGTLRVSKGLSNGPGSRKPDRTEERRVGEEGRT